MGIINKTEEEKKLRQLANNLNKNSHLSAQSLEFFINQINKIKNGGSNPFGNIDTFIKVINKINENVSFPSYYMASDHYEEIVKIYPRVVTNDRTSDLFISTFIGPEGVLANELFDEGLYSIFENKEDYFEVISIINSDSLFRNNSEEINSYIQAVSKFCLNQDILKRDIISFLEGYYDYPEDDWDKYSELKLEEAKRRIGVYSISPKDLAAVDTKLSRIEGYLDKLEIYMNSLKEEEIAIDTLINEGKKNIKQESKDSVSSLKREIEIIKKELVRKLDEYLLDLEETLKEQSDETFKKILEQYKNQVEELRGMFKAYSVAASKDLLSLQDETEAKLETLRNYSDNAQQIQVILDKANASNAVSKKLIQLMTKEEQLMEAAKVPEKVVTPEPTEQVVIPGFDRIMVPYRHIVLPEEVSTDIISVLDESIPFEKRLAEVEKRMAENEKNGEIYHKKIKQIAIDIMEGDWPYLWGPSGTGKSHMVKQVADLLGMNLMKAGKITEPYSILGYNDPQGRYRITPTFMAALYGYLLSLDEFDNGNPDTQIVLNDIYSELLNKIDEPNEVCEVMFGDDIPVNINPNFRMVAAGNTSGEGENSVFSSRGKIDESIQERMTPIFIDYDNRVEQLILKDYPEWYKFFISFREACSTFAKNNGLDAPQGTTTTRDATAIKKYIDHNSKSIDQIIFERFIQIKDSEYRKALAKTIATKYNIDYDSVVNPKFNGQLHKADAKVLAKKFVYHSKKGVE